MRFITAFSLVIFASLATAQAAPVNDCAQARRVVKWSQARARINPTGVADAEMALAGCLAGRMDMLAPGPLFPSSMLDESAVPDLTGQVRTLGQLAAPAITIYQRLMLHPDAVIRITAAGHLGDLYVAMATRVRAAGPAVSDSNDPKVQRELEHRRAVVQNLAQPFADQAVRTYQRSLDEAADAPLAVRRSQAVSMMIVRACRALAPVTGPTRPLCQPTLATP